MERGVKQGSNGSPVFFILEVHVVFEDLKVRLEFYRIRVITETFRIFRRSMFYYQIDQACLKILEKCKLILDEYVMEMAYEETVWTYVGSDVEQSFRQLYLSSELLHISWLSCE